MELTVFYFILGIIILIIAGVSKGITGLGLPVIATPLFAIFLDLQTTIALVLPSTVITDLIMASRFFKKDFKLIKSISFLILFGILGILIGSQLLVVINLTILTGALSIAILSFVIISWFNIIPKMNKRPPIILDATIGMIGGVLQGAAGASGPIITMYLFQIKQSRENFLFIINSFFVIVGITQFIRLCQLGLFYDEIITYSLVAFIPSLVGLLLSFKIQKYVTDEIFKKLILILIGISGLVLAIKLFIY